MKIELCAASQEAIQIASNLQIDRIELCQNLDQGGLTPSAGMIKYAKDLGLEAHVLIRPRAGGFHYSEEEIKLILNDVQFCKDFGVDGIVVGFLQPNFEIDTYAIEQINSIRGDLKLTFHRAFDDTIEWRRSLDKLISCGVDRILTSGFASNVDIGLPNLIEMTNYANERIEIMPGGGVNAGNILKIKRELEPESIHFSGTIKVLMDEDSAFSETLLKADANRIAKLCDLIRG
ncbi:MAG: copper homeostasis protein CutC [Crocinitomicaceae bacterium]|jgi:copper homeostasis protein